MGCLWIGDVKSTATADQQTMIKQHSAGYFPAVHAQMVSHGSPVRLGQHIDALYNGGWWWCRVLSFTAAGSVTVKAMEVWLMRGS